MKAIIKQPRRAQSEDDRLNGARAVVFWSYLALVTSFAFAKRGLGISHLAFDLMLVIFPVATLAVGGLWLVSRSEWFQSLPSPAEPRQSEKQRQSKRRGLVLDCISNVYMGAFFGFLAFEMLQNPLLGWIYKTGLIAAVNVFALAVSRYAVIAFSYQNARKRNATKRPTIT